jgi:hypothetical protein
MHAFAVGASPRCQSGFVAALASLCGSLIASGGCSSLAWNSARKAPLNVPTHAAARPPLEHGPLVIHADFELAPNHPLIAELAAERTLISDRLGFSSGDVKIHVHLFADEASYRRRVDAEFPGFPRRRAIFVEADGQLRVFAHWSDRVAEDLRHEVAHGYLHAAVPGLPLWLDEGLAEYFEVGDGGRGLHAGHAALVRQEHAASRWRPDLARLEGIKSAADMRQIDYAEAWLWVHFMLNASEASNSLLLNHLAELRSGRRGADLSVQIQQQILDVEAAVLAHLAVFPE